MRLPLNAPSTEERLMSHVAMSATQIKNENQPRRNEEHEDFFWSFFVLFVSSWLIFLEGSFYGLQRQRHISGLVAVNFNLYGSGLEPPGGRGDAVFRLLGFQPESELAALL